MNRIKSAKVKIELLDEITSDILSKLKGIKMTYKVVGLKPKTEYNYNVHDYVTVYDNDGNPEMTDDWQLVEKTEDELTEVDKARIEILHSILSALGGILDEV